MFLSSQLILLVNIKAVKAIFPRKLYEFEVKKHYYNVFVLISHIGA